MPNVKLSEPAPKPAKPEKPPVELSPYTKSAILLIAIGITSSASILRNLPEEEVEKISVEVARLKNVTSETLTAVIEEYYGMMTAKQAAA